MEQQWITVVTDNEADILVAEVEKAAYTMKNLKHPGTAESTAGIIKDIGDTGISILQKLCNNIWNAGCPESGLKWH